MKTTSSIIVRLAFVVCFGAVWGCGHHSHFPGPVGSASSAERAISTGASAGGHEQSAGRFAGDSGG